MSRTLTANREFLNEDSLHIKIPRPLKKRMIVAAQNHGGTVSQIVRRMILNNISLFEKNNDYF